MRSTLLNRSNSNVLGLRRDRRVATVKNVLAVIIAHAQSFFRHAAATTAHYLTALERQLKRGGDGSVGGGSAVGSQVAQAAMCESPRAASCAPSGWQAAALPRFPLSIS